MVDFFVVAPAIKAPLSFDGCLLLSLLAGGIGFISALFGGINRCEMRSKQIRLERSSLSWLSRDCRRFWRLCWLVLICLSTTAVMVLGRVGCSAASIAAVWLALFSRRCLMATRFRFREIALWEYFVMYVTCALMKHARMVSWMRETSGWSGEMANMGLYALGLVVSTWFIFVSLGIVEIVGMVLWCVVSSSSSVAREARAS